MLQVLARKGKVLPSDLPAPLAEPGTLLVKAVRSCVSAGTELTTIARTGGSLIRRALDQPAAAWKALNVVRREGVAAVAERLSGKRDIGSALGYSASGIVVAAGEGVPGFRPGDRVAVGGAGIANHAEYIQAPLNMVTRVPDSVGFDAASTVALGAIALHAARRASLAVGELAVVYGTGTIGQLVVQILAASGVRVIAVDLDAARLSMALGTGAEAAVNPRDGQMAREIRDITGGQGADAVIYCASGADAAALSACASCARRRGRLVLVGTWDGGIQRADLYARELDVLMSTSYGPGRYDERYEKGGVDYPYAYVRWTEGRNMEEYLRLLATGKVAIDRLIESTFPVSRAEEAFQRLSTEPRPLFVLLDYGTEMLSALRPLAPDARRLTVTRTAARQDPTRIRVGVIGAGGFTSGVHLPNLRALENLFELRAICCRTGASAKAAAVRFDAGYATTEAAQVLEDPEIDLVLVCTGPALHAELTMKALRAGKSVLVEKPLCLTPGELAAIDDCVRSLPAGGPVLAVGFNRRFSPGAQEMKASVESRINPLFLRYRMNAGCQPSRNPGLPPQDGGRIIGEACHAIDFASFLCASPVRAYGAAALRPATTSLPPWDNASISLEYEDGSVAVIDYFAVGSAELPKENVEVHFDGKSIVLDNFQELRGYGVNVSRHTSDEPRKGHREELAAIADHLRGRRPGWPIPWESIRETTQITFEVSGRTDTPLEVQKVKSA